VRKESEVSMAASSGKSKKRSGFDASYLSGLSEQANEADIFGPEVTAKHQELQQELATADQSVLPYIVIAFLHDNPYQGRRSMDEEELQKLADEIKESGFQGALAARPHPTEADVFQIVSGHRRKTAAAMAGLLSLPVIVKPYSDEDMLFLQAKENLLREQLTPLDEAYMFQNMVTMGYTQEAVAAKVRQSRGYVRNRLALVKAPLDVQEMVKKDKETVRAAYYLSDIEDTQVRTELIQALVERRITGESIPGYLATLKEAQQHQQEVLQPRPQEVTTRPDARITDEQDATGETRGLRLLKPRTPEASSEQTQQRVALPQDAPRPSISVEQIMESGEKRSKELLEAGKLRTMLSQLQGYQSRTAKRQAPLSNEELTLLQSIEALCQSLQQSY